MKSFLHELTPLILEEWQAGREPPSAMLTLVEHGTLWIIRLHKAVFSCAVIVHLYSALYSSTLFLDGPISAERQGFWLLHGKPQTELSAVVTEQRPLESVWGGDVKFSLLFLSPSYSPRARGGKGGHARCHCMSGMRMCVCVCLCGWVPWLCERMQMVWSIGSKGLNHVSGHCLPPSHLIGIEKGRQFCVFVSEGGGRGWVHLSLLCFQESGSSGSWVLIILSEQRSGAGCSCMLL